MSKIRLRTLKSRKTLRAISFKPVLSVGFADEAEDWFEITFDCGDGMLRDLVISFETRSPHLYISETYTKENWEARNSERQRSLL